MKFDKGNAWRPPHCEFIGMYRYEQEDYESTPDEDVEGYVPDYRDIVPEGTPFFAVVREKDGFSDTAGVDTLAASVANKGYDYEIVRRRPPEAEEVTREEYEEIARDALEDGASEREADEIAAETVGFNPHLARETNLLFYWV